jgi:hypothetical protein
MATFRSNIPQVQRMIKQKTKEAMQDIVLDLTRRSKELAPLDTGDLRGSGFGEVEAMTNNVIGTVSFNTPYALIQHEDMSFNHPRGGQAKYLEQPLNQNRDRYKSFIQNKIREVTE